MNTYTATCANGSHTIAIHATGCQHAINPDLIVGAGYSIEGVMQKAMQVVDPDNDYPGWTKRISPCAKKIA